MKMENKEIKALCLSGGGSKGAFIGGMLEYMKLIRGKEYDMYVASSTGSLLQTLVSINDFKSLKEGYTTISLDDIYSVKPFSKKSTIKNVKFSIFNMLKMIFIKKQPTFGDTSNLKKLINKFFPKEKYIESLNKGKNIIACVSNLSKIQSEYYSSQNLGCDGYDEFCDWTWISCNAVPFTSLVKRGKLNDYYCDGGYLDHMPICKAISEGATEIDAFDTNSEFDEVEPIDIGNNALVLISRLFEAFLVNSSKRDIERAMLMAREKDIKINIYYTPRKLISNPMFFDKKIMSDWWDEGYTYAENINDYQCRTIILDKNI